MIINFPTGFYADALPQTPEESGNITFVISNTRPPRSDLLFPKIPKGVDDRRRIVSPFDPVADREQVGDQIFSISQASRAEEGSNIQQFEVGHILDFDDSTVQATDPMLVRQTTELRHDVFKVDFDALGLTGDEQELINDETAKARNTLVAALNTAKRERADAEVRIAELQKSINNLNRAIDALQVVTDNDATTESEVDDLVDKLTAQLTVTQTALSAAIETANTQAQIAADTLAELRTVSTIVT